jgi:cyclopropane-fatty-acyl-phospholipid synthase
MSAGIYQKLVLRMLHKMQSGTLYLSLPDSAQIKIGGKDGPVAEMTINDPAFFRQVVLYGDVGLGEAYMEKRWDTKNLTNLISWFIQNLEYLPSLSGAKKVFSPLNLLKISNRVLHILKPNSLKGSKLNISKHYDLSNEFFRNFLDSSMTYSSAFFTQPEQSLEQAQTEKYEQLCLSTGINENDHVLEIGCGWGGFAEHAAKKYGCKVTGVTISKEQFEFARARILKEKLQDRVNIILEDYRNIKGKFDKVVSIEMIEAVGHKYFPVYFSKINNLLKSDGVLGLQAIIIPDSRYDEYRKGVDWIQKHIFPGGLLPSIGVINKTVNKVSDLYLQQLREFGLSYGKTLNHWYGNLFNNLDKVKSLGFDETFIRKWEYYLCYCEAAFNTRNINVVQMVFTRPNNQKFNTASL